MKFDMHGEYPVILRETEEGIIGVWYENRFKDQSVLLNELDALGKTEEVAAIKSYGSLGAQPPTFERRLEIQRRIQRLAHTVKDYNPFQVIEIIGKAAFEPLISQHWAVSGTSYIEFEIDCSTDQSEFMQYRLQLDAGIVVQIATWVNEKWTSFDEVRFERNDPLHDKFQTIDGIASPCK